ncbi:MAG: hypothetical protein ACI95T_000405 [Flavobacteriales bacterium]|jgi:hypothetical protein|tara:strand:+ start:458 stop:955 length:498 start_codon:yes stop_codon:yes gene_type:complete
MVNISDPNKEQAKKTASSPTKFNVSLRDELADNTKTKQKGIIKVGQPRLFNNDMERKNHYSIETNEPATDGPGDGIKSDWGILNYFKKWEPFAGNTNPVVSNNVRGNGDSPVIKISGEKSSMITTETVWGKDSSRSVTTYKGDTLLDYVHYPKESKFKYIKTQGQ